MTSSDAFARPRRGNLPSLLAPWLKLWLVSVLAGTALLVANSLYLSLVRLADWAGIAPFALGSERLGVLYQAMLLAHTGVGILLGTLALVFVAAHLPSVWRRLRRSVVASGLAGLLLVGTVAATGLFILTEAASRANAWAWWLHVSSATALPAAYLVHRRTGSVGVSSRSVTRYFAGTVGAAVAAFMLHGATAPAARSASEGPAPPGGSGLADQTSGLSEVRPEAVEGGAPGEDVTREADGERSGPGAADDLAGLRRPAGFVDPASRFFPSPATTASQTSRSAGYARDSATSRDAERRILLDRGFLTAERWGPDAEVIEAQAVEHGFATATIGAGECVSCHPDVTEQWSSSAHRFASFNNPFYEASIAALRASPRTNEWIVEHLEASPPRAPPRAGIVKSRWCAACHDPALLFTGAMDEEVDRSSIRAQAGLTCLACHAIDSIADRTGNGNYILAAKSSPYLFGSRAPGTASRFLHDAALKARPEPHRRAMLKPVFRQAEFCATCHKVSLDRAVNEYRWLRGQNEFDAWDDSGIAHNAARTFYLPGAARSCADCHMPPEPAPLGDLAAATDGTVRSHRFLASNTALPWLRGDTATVRLTEAFLAAGKLRVDIFAVRGDGTGAANRMALSDSVALPAAVPLTMDVVVRNLDVGHSFPGGTNDSNEAWLELRLVAENGVVVAQSGAVGADGQVDPLAHFFRVVAIDSLGERISRRNPQDIRAIVYSNLIGPGNSDLAHYRFTLPRELEGGRVSVSARLLWRKFDRDFTEFAFAANPAGFVGFDAPPDLPVTVIAADTVLVTVTGTATIESVPQASAAVEPWVRYNDYGIALLGEGDTRRASEVFRSVEQLEPDRVDGSLNLARATLAAGALEATYDALERAEEIEQGNAQVAWVWGLTLQADGEYDASEAAFRRVLADFPRDRASWRELGRTLYLKAEFEEALEAFGEVLHIDPEDRVSHYHRMLSLRALGREGEALLAEAHYLRHSIDESAQELALAFRARDPGANIMAQPIPTRELEVYTREPEVNTPEPGAKTPEPGADTRQPVVRSR